MTEEEQQLLSDLRKKLPIDQFELERECCQQPIVYDEVGEWVALVKAKSKTAKEHVSFVESDLTLRIRKNPEDFGLKKDVKPTVDAVAASIKVSPAYIQAFEEYIEADKLANEAAILLESVGQRKSSIRDLVRLFISHYYEKTDELNHEEWKNAERAIYDLRNKKAAEEEDNAEDNVEVE